MKAETLFECAVNSVAGVVVAIAFVLTAFLCSPIWLCEKVYNFFKNNQLAREAVQLGAILAIFVALYIILPLVFQNP